MRDGHPETHLGPAGAPWCALLVALGVLLGAQTVEEPPEPPAPVGIRAPAAASPPVHEGSLGTATEISRASSQTPLRRRVRTRSRYDDVLGEPRWESLLPGSRFDARRGIAAEALRIVKTRATLALSWGAIHREARSGVLHAHSSACPPPTGV